jgi:hypothetical protein
VKAAWKAVMMAAVLAVKSAALRVEKSDD